LSVKESKTECFKFSEEASEGSINFLEELS